MGSYPRCAPRSGRCEGRQGVVCVRVCLAEASVGLIGGCVRSCRLGGARRHPPPRATVIAAAAAVLAVASDLLPLSYYLHYWQSLISKPQMCLSDYCWGP
eukprot:COSAG01_NODE_3504_length_5994_cov_47.750000_3_plen_100_part_00